MTKPEQPSHIAQAKKFQQEIEEGVQSGDSIYLAADVATTAWVLGIPGKTIHEMAEKKQGLHFVPTSRGGDVFVDIKLTAPEGNYKEAYQALYSLTQAASSHLDREHGENMLADLQSHFQAAWEVDEKVKESLGALLEGKPTIEDVDREEAQQLLWQFWNHLPGGIQKELEDIHPTRVFGVIEG